MILRETAPANTGMQAITPMVMAMQMTSTVLRKARLRNRLNATERKARNLMSLRRTSTQSTPTTAWNTDGPPFGRQSAGASRA